MTMKSDRGLSIPQAASIWGCSAKVMRRMIREHGIRTYPAGSDTRIRLSVLMDWRERLERRQGSASYGLVQDSPQDFRSKLLRGTS